LCSAFGGWLGQLAGVGFVLLSAFRLLVGWLSGVCGALLVGSVGGFPSFVGLWLVLPRLGLSLRLVSVSPFRFSLVLLGLLLPWFSVLFLAFVLALVSSFSSSWLSCWGFGLLVGVRPCPLL
jgi:hypothetical protein